MTEGKLIDKVHVFFFNYTATTEIYTLSLHDALPISGHAVLEAIETKKSGGELPDGLIREVVAGYTAGAVPDYQIDRKSTRLNSSHANISYAVFCLKKKTNSFHTFYLGDIS